MQTSLTRSLLTALCLTLWSAAAWAQTTTLTPATLVVAPGASVTATVTGPAGHNFVVIGSATNSGASYGGVSLAVGADAVALATGVLNGNGSATVTLAPQFQNNGRRYYLQAATSPSGNFLPLAVSSSVVLQNADLVGNLPLAVMANPNGSLQYASQGVTVTRTGVGAYRITYPGLLTSPVIPQVTAIDTAVQSYFYDLNTMTVQLSGDAFFTVLFFPVRP